MEESKRQNDNRRRNGFSKEQKQSLKMMGTDEKTGLTPNLMRLFMARPPLEYKEPIEKKTMPRYTGMAQFLSAFAEPNDPEYAPPSKPIESLEEIKAKRTALKLEKGAEKLAEEVPKYDPWSDPNVRGDAYKTMFISNLSYDTNESRLQREFERYGSVRRVRIVMDKDGKSRGYAFVEFKHTSDMKGAYKRSDGIKIDNRRIRVDVERGRTIKKWLPRRLGGGLGDSRSANKEPARGNNKRTRSDRDEGRRDQDEHHRSRDDRDGGRSRKERERNEHHRGREHHSDNDSKENHSRKRSRVDNGNGERH